MASNVEVTDAARLHRAASSGPQGYALSQANYPRARRAKSGKPFAKGGTFHFLNWIAARYNSCPCPGAKFRRGNNNSKFSSLMLNVCVQPLYNNLLNL